MTTKAVLLINLGSPAGPHTRPVARYLREFLMDPYVMDLPLLLRFFLVNFIIIPRRAKKSAALYRQIWTPQGSPLIVHTEALARKVAGLSGIKVYLAMRYGRPSLAEVFRQMAADGIEQVYSVPLYPQYAMSTTLTVNREVGRQAARHLPGARLTTAPPFYRHPDYIRVLAASIRKQLGGTDFRHLLFSYHGVPERHLRKTDPTGRHCLSAPDCCTTPSEAHAVCYRHQCLTTTRLVAGQLGLKPEQYSVSFQSRLGKDPWLKPYTDQHIRELAGRGITRLAVVTPAFVSDCLETIEEIGQEARQLFLQAGGKDFYRIGCLNDDEKWAGTLATWARQVFDTAYEKD